MPRVDVRPNATRTDRGVVRPHQPGRVRPDRGGHHVVPSARRPRAGRAGGGRPRGADRERGDRAAPEDTDVAAPITGERYAALDQRVATMQGRARASSASRSGASTAPVLYSNDPAEVGTRPGIGGRPRGGPRRSAHERHLRSDRGRERSASGRWAIDCSRPYVPFRVGDERPRPRRRHRGLPGLLRDPVRGRPPHAHAVDLARHRTARAVRRVAPPHDRDHPDAPATEPPAPGTGGSALRSVGARAGHRRRAPRARPHEERLRRGDVARAADAAHQHPRLRPHPARVGDGGRSGRGRGARGDRAAVEPAVPLDRQRAPRVQPRARRRGQRGLPVPVRRIWSTR